MLFSGFGFRKWELILCVKEGSLKNAAKLSSNGGSDARACARVCVPDVSVSAQNCLMSPSSRLAGSASGIRRIRVFGMETCITVLTCPLVHATTASRSGSSMCLLVVESCCGASVPAAVGGKWSRLGCSPSVVVLTV